MIPNFFVGLWGSVFYNFFIFFYNQSLSCATNYRKREYQTIFILRQRQESEKTMEILFNTLMRLLLQQMQEESALTEEEKMKNMKELEKILVTEGHFDEQE